MHRRLLLLSKYVVFSEPVVTRVQVGVSTQAQTPGSVASIQMPLLPPSEAPLLLPRRQTSGLEPGIPPGPAGQARILSELLAGRAPPGTPSSRVPLALSCLR